MTILSEKPTLFVVARQHDLLEKHGDVLRVVHSESGEIKKKIPALALRDIVVCGQVSLDSDVFALAEKHKLPIHFLSKGGEYRASVIFDFSKNIFLRHRQFKIFDQPASKLAVAKQFVTAKVHNQNIVLRKMRTKKRLEIVIEAETPDQLRGAEGSAARIYFSIWKEEKIVKNEAVDFPGRHKRPAMDPVNALLSFCFTLLHSEVHSQLLIAGLDPFMGYLHEPTYGHPALASDFVEIFRGPVELFVLRAINRKEFDIDEDFERDIGGAVKLSRRGFEKFFPKWSEFLRKEDLQDGKNLTRLIEKDVRKFVHFLMGDEETFQPFWWKI